VPKTSPGFSWRLTAISRMPDRLCGVSLDRPLNRLTIPLTAASHFNIH
jgi:hypothetical protein